MKKMVGKLLYVVQRISYFGGAVPGMVLLAATVVLITLEIILRFAFNTSTKLADEYAAYFFVGMLYLAAARTLQTDSHIKIDVVLNRLSDKRRFSLRRFFAVVNIPVFMLLTWRAWHIFLDAYQYEVQAATIVATPLYIPIAVIPLGFTILSLQGLAEVLRLFTTPSSANRNTVEYSEE